MSIPGRQDPGGRLHNNNIPEAGYQAYSFDSVECGVFSGTHGSNESPVGVHNKQDHAPLDGVSIQTKSDRGRWVSSGARTVACGPKLKTCPRDRRCRPSRPPRQSRSGCRRRSEPVPRRLRLGLTRALVTIALGGMTSVYRSPFCVSPAPGRPPPSVPGLTPMRPAGAAPRRPGPRSISLPPRPQRIPLPRYTRVQGEIAPSIRSARPSFRRPPSPWPAGTLPRSTPSGLSA